MPKLVLEPQRRTNPVIWFLAIICAVIAVTVIIAGIIVFIGYLTVQPKVPAISVVESHLDRIYYDQAGVLAVQIMIKIRAQNGNIKAHAYFYHSSFVLSFHGIGVAKLVADPFDVGKNSSVELSYEVESSAIPLPLEQQYSAEESLRQNQVLFYLRGTTRTRWQVGPLGSVKFWLHLDCELLLPINGSVARTRCSSKSH